MVKLISALTLPNSQQRKQSKLWPYCSILMNFHITWPAFCMLSSVVFIIAGSQSTKPCSAEPTQEEFMPLTATVAVLNEQEVPLPHMYIQAVNHEFGLRLQTETDANGMAVLDIMPGTWNFYSMPTYTGLCSKPNHGYFLVAQNEVFDSTSRGIILAPDTTVEVNLTSPVFDFTARENYIGFVHTPWGKYLAATVCGVTTGGQPLTLHTNAELTARCIVNAPRHVGDLLYFIGEPVVLMSPLTIEVNDLNSALLDFNAMEVNGTSTDYHIQLQSADLTWAWSPWIADILASQKRVRIAPGTYQMVRGVDAYDKMEVKHRIILNPTVVSLTAGETLQMSIGGPLQVPQVRTTPRAAAAFAPACQIWLPMCDANGNNVTHIEKWGEGRLWPTVYVEYGTQASTLFTVGYSFTAWLAKQFDRQDDPTYRIEWNFGPWGSGSKVGDLYGQAERRLSIHETESLLSQVPRMEDTYRRPKVLDYEAHVQAMADAMGVPVDYQLGVISNIACKGFEDEVQSGYKNEVGIEDNRATGWSAGDSYLDHEAGHGRIHTPPCRFYAYQVYGESYATLAGVKGRSLLYGGEEYMTFLLGGHDKFLRHQHGEALQFPSDHIQTMQFVTHYINSVYGWRPHQRMIIEWENAFRGIRQAMTEAFEPYSKAEQFAVLYSWLCEENLWALFTAAGFPINSDRIDSGLAIINSHVASTGLSLGIGYNQVFAPHTSIPLELVASPQPGVTKIEVTIKFDSSLAVVRSVCARDLANTQNCELTNDTSQPGIVTIQISSMIPLVGVGSLAQINLELRPDAHDPLPFTIVNAKADGEDVFTIDNELDLPSTPIIIEFPTLPAAVCREAYATVLSAIAGSPPYEWTIIEDDLPPGFTLDANTGELVGTCSQHGEFLFRVRVMDKDGQTATRWFTIVVGLPGDLYNNSNDD